MEWYPSCFQKHEKNIVWEKDDIKLSSQNMATIARGTEKFIIFASF